MEKSYGEVLYEKGMEKGELRLARSLLMDVLKNRFKKLPKAVKRQIEATTRLKPLREAILNVMDLNSLDDFRL